MFDLLGHARGLRVALPLLFATILLASCDVRSTGSGDGGWTACPELTPPEHGSMSPTTGYPGEIVYYVCDPEYSLIGNDLEDTRRCQEDSTWSGSDPQCYSACDPSPCLNGGTCRALTAGFECSCPSPYTGAVCETFYGCQEILTAPEHGSIDGAIGVPGESATYSCNPGYVLTGNDGITRRFCQYDRTWTGSAPSCEAVRAPCDPNPCLNRGTCAEDGASFTCACAAGYDGPTCEAPIACLEELRNPSDGSVDRTSGQFGDVASYACESNFYVAGEQTRTCQADGTWSGSAPTCEATDYARWPMPGTAAHPFDYEVRGDTTIAPLRGDTVLDRVTGLEWQREVGDPVRLYDGYDYCEDLLLAGRGDWRVPTGIELVSILDFRQDAPVIDPTAFPSTPAETFWAHPPRREQWISFATGKVNPPYIEGFPGHGPFRVRCVRTEVEHAPPPDGPFSIDDETVLHHATGLLWQRATSALPLDRDAAAAYCDSLVLGAETTWRLPEIAELLSITTFWVNLDPAVFSTSATPGTPLWSTTPESETRVWGLGTVGDRVALVDPDEGQTVPLDASTLAFVRCVLE